MTGRTIAGWSVTTEPDPSAAPGYVEVLGDDGQVVRAPDPAWVNPGVLVARRGDEVLRFSPSYSDAELALVLTEAVVLGEHAAGEHATPVFGCPSCAAEAAP